MRLLMRMVNSLKPIARMRSWITRTVSMSAAVERVPMVSKSHCINSRKRPRWVFSPRHTVAMWYRLKGTPSSLKCSAAKRASGTVRSNRSPTQRPPWSWNL